MVVRIFSLWSRTTAHTGLYKLRRFGCVTHLIIRLRRSLIHTNVNSIIGQVGRLKISATTRKCVINGVRGMALEFLNFD